MGNLNTECQLLAVMLLQLLVQGIALDQRCGIQHLVEVSLILCPQVQGAAKLGKTMRRDGHGLRRNRVHRGYDFAVIRTEGGDDAAIGACQRLLIVRLEIGQRGFQQGNALIAVVQCRIVLLLQHKSAEQVRTAT